MTDRFQLMRLDEVEGYAEEGRPRWHMIRSVLGIESFGINAWRATEAGQQIIGEHDELGSGAGGHEELYFVLSGRATFTVDGERVDAPAGSLVFVKDPATRRGAVADEAATEILVIGGRPGAAFSVSPWERSAEALRCWTTGDWDRRDRDPRRASSPRIPPMPTSSTTSPVPRAARAAAGAAIEHLTRAVELVPRFAELAQTDSDLDAIRGDARFPAAPAAG